MAIPSCAEKKRLLELYGSASQAYFEVMNELGTKIGSSPKPEYDRLFQVTEEARSRSELARAALLEHIRDHGC